MSSFASEQFHAITSTSPECAWDALTATGVPLDYSPSVYVTWELHGTGDGTIIRLNVDEPWPFAYSTEDLESAWLPVLSGLVKHLERARVL